MTVFLCWWYINLVFITRLIIMTEKEDYRSKLRTPNKGKPDTAVWANSSPDFGDFPLFWSSPSPIKHKQYNVNELSPHKSGYLLRTPSPHKASLISSPSHINIKSERKGTPSPHKAISGTDLFGNRSLLDNLPIPEWDDNFLDNFQEGFFGLVNDDLEGLVRSPAKSPRRNQPFLTNSPFKKSSPGVSPFKNPLLTSSPKHPVDSPGGSVMKTPGIIGGRPLTRQRKLFLQSPERNMPSTSSVNWPTPLPFSSLDDTTSSMFSDMGNETTGSTQNLSTYLKQIDYETNDDYPVMPPVGWTVGDNLAASMGKTNHKGKGKSMKQKHYSDVTLNTSNSSTSSLNTSSSKKAKVEPQFTLLRPHTEIHNSQISLRMTPRTPPHKLKISRDFSQIQTFPSKEQLRIVRNRFRESLNRAVEQVIEKEKKLKEQKMNEMIFQNAVQEPIITLQHATPELKTNYSIHGYTAKKPIVKKKKR
ncbi:hypothetical protein Btru_037998 [Bulinus truncatus]|nr:hypothetical protein Btru_037998 [Bulinus truncatus]